MNKITTLLISLLVTNMSSAAPFELTQIDRPDIAPELMHVSKYPEVKVAKSDLPINMDGLVDVRFNKEYKIVAKGENISAKLQSAIDKYAEKGGAKIHIDKGDYFIQGVKLRSNIHLLIDGGTILRPYTDNPKGAGCFADGMDRGGAPTVENVSIQGVGGRVDVLLAEELHDLYTKFVFINSRLVKGFYYANFNIYDHSTQSPSLGFGGAEPNPENFIGPTDGVVMNFTAIDAHFGYGLVQASSGRYIRFYNMHGIGGLTLRLETGSGNINETQFGGVFDITGENISVVNGHGAVMCLPHGMKNGVVHFDGITAVASGEAFMISETEEGSRDLKSVGNAGSFSDGSSVNNVTAIYGTKAQIKMKHLYAIPWELRDQVQGRSYTGIFNEAPSHTCVRIAGSIKIDYDPSTFHAIGFPEQYEYCRPIRYVKNDEDKVKAHQSRMSEYLKTKFGPSPPITKRGAHPTK